MRVTSPKKRKIFDVDFEEKHTEEATSEEALEIGVRNLKYLTWLPDVLDTWVVICMIGFMEIKTLPLPLFRERWVSQRPYATDKLQCGIQRMSRLEALTKKYIEANPKALVTMLIVDIDHPDAVLRALWERPATLPNLVVENVSNGHAHMIYFLHTPVPTTEYAHRKPLAYLEAVLEGLRRSVDGDRAYSMLMTKNPLHGHWKAYEHSEKLYTLDELAIWLESIECMPDKTWAKHRRKKPVGLGRNCTLFEQTRTWAYRELRHYFGNPQSLHTAITQHVKQLNTEFTEPLADREAEDIANSIHRWITTRSQLWKDGHSTYQATFTLIQSARGKKGGKKSGEKRNQWRQKIVEVDNGCNISD